MDDEEDFFKRLEIYLKDNLRGVIALAITPLVFHFIPSLPRYLQLSIEYLIYMSFFIWTIGMSYKFKKYKNFVDNEDSNND